MSTINWHANSWFAKCHADNLTEEFKAWWVEFYGPPEQYEGAPDEQDEYWVRCAFAWNGWNARKGVGDNANC